jgi:hypothetical protein
LFYIVETRRAASQSNNKKIKNINKLKFLMPIGLLTVLAGFSAAVMLLWNWLMPALFGLVTINFWQALGICVLCRILFGSFNPWHHRKHRIHGKAMHGMRNHLREKWQKMTPEERTAFINKRREQGFFGRHGFDPFATNENTPKDRE